METDQNNLKRSQEKRLKIPDGLSIYRKEIGFQEIGKHETYYEQSKFKQWEKPYTRKET